MKLLILFLLAGCCSAQPLPWIRIWEPLFTPQALGSSAPPRALGTAVSGGMGVRVSFSQQGAETLRAVSGGVIPSVGVLSVNACSDSDMARVVPAGQLYDAARALGISTVSPVLAGPLLDRAKNKSKAQIVLDVGTGVSGTVGAIGTISSNGSSILPRQATIPLLLAPLAVSLVNAYVSKRLPADQSVRANLLQGKVGIGAHDCEERLMLFLFHGYWAPKMTVIP